MNYNEKVAKQKEINLAEIKRRHKKSINNLKIKSLSEISLTKGGNNKQ